MEEIVLRITNLIDKFDINFLIDTASALLVFLVLFFIRNKVSDKVASMFKRLVEKTPYKWDDILLDYSRKPINGLLIILSIYWFLKIFPLTSGEAVLWAKLLRTSIIILVAISLAGFMENMAAYWIKNSRDIEVEETLLPMLKKSVGIIVFLLALLIVANEWNYDIKALIAGFGLAGFAVAMAAQDTISNFLAGIFIISDKTFKVGDWVSTSTVEGIVEELFFRTTKIRTFSQALITVPNKTLANEPLTNWSKMGMRKIRLDLKVTHQTTAEKIKKVTTEITEMLKGSDSVVQDTVVVRFVTFSESSLDIMVEFFTDKLDFNKYIHIKEDTNFKIMELLEKEGVKLAYPTRTVFIENMGNLKMEIEK